MLKRVKGYVLVFIKLLFSSVLFFSLIFPWWMSADARYARDNLRYLDKRMSETEIKEAIPNWKISLMTEPDLIARICEMSDTWADGYLNAIVKAEEITGEYYLDSSLNPYDTLARLVLAGNEKDVQEIYLTVQYDAAVLNPDSEMTGLALEQWKNDSYEIRKTSYNLLSRMAEKMRVQLLIGITGILLIWLYRPLNNLIRQVTSAG